MPDAQPEPGDITLLLRKAQQGDADAAEDLFRQLLADLRFSARRLMQQERPDHTLQASALINEACLQMLNQNVMQTAGNRRYLFAAANRALRQVLVDHARHRNAAKREGQWQKNSLDTVLDRLETHSGCTFEELNAALIELENDSPRQREVVEHRFFSGLSVAQTADLLGVSPGTVERDWRLARTKLYAILKH
ncbi:MAG: ECF-type sigma factor [Planctomycetaceae bacterium]